MIARRHDHRGVCGGRSRSTAAKRHQRVVERQQDNCRARSEAERAAPWRWRRRRTMIKWTELASRVEMRTSSAMAMILIAMRMPLGGTSFSRQRYHCSQIRTPVEFSKCTRLHASSAVSVPLLNAVAMWWRSPAFLRMLRYACQPAHTLPPPSLSRTSH